MYIQNKDIKVYSTIIICGITNEYLTRATLLPTKPNYSEHNRPYCFLSHCFTSKTCFTHCHLLRKRKMNTTLPYYKINTTLPYYRCTIRRSAITSLFTKMLAYKVARVKDSNVELRTKLSRIH